MQTRATADAVLKEKYMGRRKGKRGAYADVLAKRTGGASPNSEQHLAARLAQARSRKGARKLYKRALR